MGRTPSTWGSKKRPEGERGIALLLVLTMVVMFTAFVADFAYTSRVKYTMASHARDAARAEALAVSGVRLYQLLLVWGDSAQKQLARSPFASFLGGILGSGSLVVKLIPCMDTGLLRMLGGGGLAPLAEGDTSDAGGVQNLGGLGLGGKEEPDSAPVGSFLDFEGNFSTCVADESTKISLNGMIKGDGINSPGAQLLLQSLKREQYQLLFREYNITPEEVVSNIIDWADLNGERANGQGYEDNLYNKGPDPYNSKNAPYDSVSELHLVAGMNDEIYEIVAPLVTAHHSKETISLPLTGPEMLAALLRAAVPNHRWTEADIQQTWEQYQLNSGGIAPENVQALVSILQLSNSTLVTLATETLQPYFSDKSRPKVFRVTSTGQVGDVERTVEAVIDVQKNKRYGGFIVYWREE